MVIICRLPWQQTVYATFHWKLIVALLVQQFVSLLPKTGKWTNNNEHVSSKSYTMGAVVLCLELATLMTRPKTAQCSAETAPKPFRHSTKSGIFSLANWKALSADKKSYTGYQSALHATCNSKIYKWHFLKDHTTQNQLCQ